MTDKDLSGATQSFHHGRDEPSTEVLTGSVEPLSHPTQIGRYQIEKLLGRGSFGLVYLGRDDQLERSIAIKVPHPQRLLRPDDARLYLAEARTVASLDHPHIAPVYDVGSEEQYPCFIVSKFIEGTDLSAKLRQQRMRYTDVAELVATIAETLHYAHKQGLVHRDVKPANIMIGNDGKPYVVDFGLALREENVEQAANSAGTPSYMSPEQARGEGHRVDGRSDIFSLGAVLYEMLAGRRAFTGKSTHEILEKISWQEPKPPRQWEDAIPKELERICLKALAKRVSERYNTALDMAEDLRVFLGYLANHPEKNPPPEYEVKTSPDPAWQDSGSSNLGTDTVRLHILPKGLRAFDEHDAEFFLDLLPGPRDREGLPESLRFWKTRIEQPDPDETFSVGLIYGPSGCGKTSLVKAGLLPCLSADVLPIYIEATPDDLEARLLRGIRKHCPAIDANLGLKETLAALRRDEDHSGGRKLVILLDQFEQWLHVRKDQHDAELVQALRQCDGGRVQAIVMVRDDFWLAVSRFLREVEVRLVEGHNIALVDLFDIDHAEWVLGEYGRAFHKIPDRASDMTRDQSEFLKQSVAGMAEDGKVVCVQLALYAEMMKSKPWTLASLKEVGGTEGAGIAFLEETFRSSLASPGHRYHQRAARAVLRALLPEPGTAIKGQMKTEEELREVSGYRDHPHEFEDLIKLLDSEIRLITPTDPETAQREADDQDAAGSSAAVTQAQSSEPPPLSPSRCYQLTHDYMVRPLQEWLSQKQRETRRGRAELLLEDRAAIWNIKTEKRQLPSLWEFLKIFALTSARKWSGTQQRMMAEAGKRHLLRCLLALGVVLGLLAGTNMVRSRLHEARVHARVDGLIDQLLVAEISEIPQIASLLEKEPLYSLPRLETIADDPARRREDRLRSVYVLADGPGLRASQLARHALTADLPTVRMIRNRLAPFTESLSEELWSALRADSSRSSEQLRAATLLAVADPAGENWEDSASAVVSALLIENTLHLDEWIELLSPCAPNLLPELRDRYLNTAASSTENANAARVLAWYADVDLLCDLILNAEPAQFSALFPGTSRYPGDALQTFLSALEQRGSAEEDEHRRSLQLRNATIALLRFEQFDLVQELLSETPDPTTRTLCLLDLHDFGLPPESVLDALAEFQNPIARQALLLAMERYRGRELAPRTHQRLDSLLEDLLKEARHPAERSAAEWLLRRWDQDEKTRRAVAELARIGGPTEEDFRERRWWVDSEGHVMSIIRGPRRFRIGSPPEEEGHSDNETLRTVTIGYDFAASAHEVAIHQFKRFAPAAEFATDVAKSPDCPANKISLLDSMKYCRWLSEQEDIEDDQMCYPPPEEITIEHARLSDEMLRKEGYRLLTEEEWECVCRAGSETPWFFGKDEEHLMHFAWFGLNSKKQLHPVGSLMPNAYGLFDISGNVAEWCQPGKEHEGYVLRGGHYDHEAARVRSARRFSQSETGYSFTGFRVARTLPAFR